MKFKVLAIILFSLNLVSLALASESIFVKGKLSNWNSFVVYEDQLSFLLQIESESNEKIFIADLIDPSGEKMIISNHGQYSESRIMPHLYSEISSKIRQTTVTEGLGSVLVPNSDSMKRPKAGTWKFRLAVVGANKEDHTKISYSLSFGSLKKKKRKVLTFDVFIDRSSKFLDYKKTLEVFDSIISFYAGYNIRLGFHVKRKKFNIKENFDLEKLINKHQKGKRSRAEINLFQRKSEHGKKDFQGLAGCLPGFIPKVVNKHCSLDIIFDDKKDIRYDKMKKVVTHEIAHFLGLFHLSDDYYPFGTVRDPISDTYGEEDYLNVMHKTSDVFSEMNFSSGQVKVLRHHPLLF